MQTSAGQKKVAVMFLSVVLSYGTFSFGGESTAVSGRIESATVFHGQALVSRVIPVQPATGRIELVVGNLPAEIIPESLYAEGEGGLSVQAVRYRQSAVSEEPRDAVRKLDVEIEELTKKLNRNGDQQLLLKKQLGCLDKLENFTAPTATTELSKGVLDAAVLEKTITFLFQQRKTLAFEKTTLTEEAETLNKQLALMRNQRTELTGNSSRTVKEAVLFINKTKAGAGQVRLNYRVGGADWSPIYCLRSDKECKTIRLELNAAVRQMSGEDWNGVALTLSTANPAPGIQELALKPFQVTLAPEDPFTTNWTGTTKPVTESRKTGNSPRGQSTGPSSGERAPIAPLADSSHPKLNNSADDLQTMELTMDSRTIKRLNRIEHADAEEPNLNYKAADPVSLAGRNDRQLVAVSVFKLSGSLSLNAVPLMSSQVYREVELTNLTRNVLPAGQVDIYYDDHFVGTTLLPTTIAGETFILGFGFDANLRVRRELIGKTELVQGGNRKLAFQYKLTLENFGEESAKVRLLDRLPQPDGASEILLHLVETKDKLSEDKKYLSTDRSRGILRWDLEVPSAAVGEKARSVVYGYALEFDRYQQLVGLNESLAAGVWSCETWGNPGSVGRLQSVPNRSGAVLELICMGGGNEKTAFTNPTRRNFLKKKSVSFEACNVGETDAHISLALITGTGREWYESKTETLPTGKWMSLRFDLNQKCWKSRTSEWQYSVSPADPADIRSMVILVYNGIASQRILVDSFRFEANEGQ